MLVPGKYTTPLHKIGENKIVPKLSNFALEVRLANLVVKKVKNSGEKYPDTREDHFKSEREELIKKRESVVEQSYVGLNKTWYQGDIVTDYVSIIDIDAQGYNQGINVIKLPFIPRELNWNTQSSFVAIKPVGRNNPRYHYTGSEDNLEFEVDWHSFDSNRDDVIKNCRAIEALSKSDGDSNPPHRVLLKWGEGDVLFRDITFIVIGAPYTLSRFNKSQYMNNTLQKTDLLPIQAIQKVTLARITRDNLSYKDITQVYSKKYY